LTKPFENIIVKIKRDLEVMERELLVGNLPEFRIKLVYLGNIFRYLRNSDLV